MSTAQTIKDNLQSLIDAAGTTTGKTYTNMTSATTALIEGYGQGGGGGTKGWVTETELLQPIDITTDSRFTLENGLIWIPRDVYTVGSYQSYCSPVILDNQSTEQTLTISCDKTTQFILFYACTGEGSTSLYDFLTLTRDDTIIDKYTQGSTTNYVWKNYKFTLSPDESTTFNFKYQKDQSQAHGLDSAGFMFLELR